MEAAAVQLQAKFRLARELFAVAPRAGLAPPLAAELGAALERAELAYTSEAAPFLAAPRGEAARRAAAAAYGRLLGAADFSGQADALVGRAEAGLAAAGCPLEPGGRSRGGARADPAAAAAAAEVRRLLQAYPRAARRGRGDPFPAGGSAEAFDPEACPAGCPAPMEADPGRSVLVCRSCGALRGLVGTVFDDTQFYSQEGQKAKSGNFNPNRHFLHWWTRVFALEDEAELGDPHDPENLYGEKVLAGLRRLVDRDRKLLRLLTVAEVRAMLRELNLTRLNENVALLLKKLTGVGPPLPDPAVARRAENLFQKAIAAKDKVCSAGNRKYYPFYIFKILDQILLEPESRRVLYYIHVQEPETIKAHDREWALICDEVPELEFRATDAALGLRYRPF